MLKQLSILKLVFATTIFWLFFALQSVYSETPKTPENGPIAVFISIEGAIGPATKDYFVRSLEKATEKNASLFIIKMNTPGGLDSSMRDIIKEILASPIPVVTYVTPSGARAASAGTYILYASHIAAMSPATNLGAATPVQIGGASPPELPTEPGDKSGKNGDKQPVSKKNDAMSRKAINDAVAYIQGLAELRGRNKEWAEKAVLEAASLTATDALKQNVIDLIATDISDLLKQLQGKKIKIQQQDITIDTQGIILESIEPDWRNQLLSIITDPNVAYILMLIGIYGLIFEFSNPGAMIPGTVGAICLLLALFAFQALPINYAGFALIALGIIFMIAEAFVPSFGALGIGGVVAFVVGSIILMDTEVPGFGVSLPLIGAFALVSSALFTIVLVMALKARRRPVVSGQEELIGAIGEALQDIDEQGYIHLHGESWNAITDSPVKKGEKLKVTKVEGLNLYVEPLRNIHEEAT
ncbi:NfeD family protein [Kaarinaea lacus]